MCSAADGYVFRKTTTKCFAVLFAMLSVCAFAACGDFFSDLMSTSSSSKSTGGGLSAGSSESADGGNSSVSQIDGNMTAGLYLGEPPANNDFTGWTGTPITSVEANDLKGAVDYIKGNANAGMYTLLISQNIRAGEQALSDNADNARMTIIGLGGERIIGFSDEAISEYKDMYFFHQSLFTVWAPGAELVLGNNITLQGVAASDEAQGAIVKVADGRFTMLPGSKITGHTTANGGYAGAGAGSYGVVHVSPYDEDDFAEFFMRGGVITGNKTADITPSMGGCVYVRDGVFVMRGGRIYNNTSEYNGGSAADVLLRGGSMFILSGNAQAGSVISVYEKRNNEEYSPAITFTEALGSNASATLHLTGIGGYYDGSEYVDETVDVTWLNYKWVYAARVIDGEDYTPTADDYAKITLGQFRPEVGMTTEMFGVYEIGTPDYGELAGCIRWLGGGMAPQRAPRVR